MEHRVEWLFCHRQFSMERTFRLGIEDEGSGLILTRTNRDRRHDAVPSIQEREVDDPHRVLSAIAVVDDVPRAEFRELFRIIEFNQIILATLLVLVDFESLFA